MRLINADAYIEWLCGQCENNKFCEEDEDGKCLLVQSIEDAPTIEERRTGHWVKVHGYCTPGGDPVWACSECGKGIHVYGIEHGTYGSDIADQQWVACPNCGAAMEGEEQ